MKFESTNFDANVFVSKNKKIYIVVYVNDLLIVEDNMNFINSVKKKLKNRFKMIDLESTQFYLDIEIVRKNDSILLRQITYLTKMLERFNMIDCKITKISMKTKLANVILLFSSNYRADVNILY